MKTIIKRTALLCVFIFCTISGYCQTPDDQSIQPYIDFLKSQNTSPIDYVMNLFERYDVVIIGERWHPELTQYDFIDQIISSPRFIEKVGHIMTEVGSNNYTEAVNNVLSTKYRTEAQFQKDLIGILRECEVQVLWYYMNFWQLLKSIWTINQTLPKSQYLDITFLNPSWSWEYSHSISAEEYKNMKKAAIDEGKYDLIMGENAINALYKIFKGPRKKALIILNQPHDLKYHKYWGYTAAACIMARFPGRVANVKLNNYVTYYEQGRAQILPAADGKWDAAFEISGNKAVGFDLAGSPFGKDKFDSYEQHKLKGDNLTYQDIFDGYVFYNPVSDMSDVIGIPGLVDSAFLPELLRRYALRGFSEADLMNYAGGDKDKDILKEFNNVRRFPALNASEKAQYDSIVLKHIDKNIK